MSFHYTLYSLPVLAAGTLNLLLASWAWRRRPAPQVIPYVVLALALAEWLVTYAIALSVYDLADRIFWAKIQYIGIGLIPSIWLVIVLQNTGRARWLENGRALLLWPVPSLCTLLVFTNEWHHLIWRQVTVQPESGFSFFSVSYGPAFWFYASYHYLILAGGATLLVATMRRASGPYRGQAIGLLVSVLLPLIGDLAYIFHWLTPPSLDVTVFAFALTSVVIGLTLFRYRLLDLVPLARDQVIEHMEDAFIATDLEGRIVDVNPATLRLLDRPAGGLIGRPLMTEMSNRGIDLAVLTAGAASEHLVELSVLGSPRTFELRMSRLFGQRERLIGRILMLRDVTNQRRSEAALREAEQRAARLQTAAEMGATVAHELNQPLTAITGYLDILRLRPRPPEQQAAILEEMDRAATDLAERIRVIVGLRKYVTKTYANAATVVDLQNSATEPVAPEP